jgi:hypothetical protein
MKLCGGLELAHRPSGRCSTRLRDQRTQPNSSADPGSNSGDWPAWSRAEFAGILLNPYDVVSLVGETPGPDAADVAEADDADAKHVWLHRL